MDSLHYAAWALAAGSFVIILANWVAATRWMFGRRDKSFTFILGFGSALGCAAVAMWPGVGWWWCLLPLMLDWGGGILILAAVFRGAWRFVRAVATGR